MSTTHHPPPTTHHPPPTTHHPPPTTHHTVAAATTHPAFPWARLVTVAAVLSGLAAAVMFASGLLSLPPTQRVRTARAAARSSWP